MHLVIFSRRRWDLVYQRPQHLPSRLATPWAVFVEEPVQTEGEAHLEERAPPANVRVLKCRPRSSTRSSSHTWNALAARIEKPDRMTFDLDPGEGVVWGAMQRRPGSCASCSRRTGSHRS
jgi:hypothetical protein